jgi:hypothetical protein
MTTWAELQDAYGSAEKTPELIAAAVASGQESGDAWDELWARLCHQGTVYSASYAALPLLAHAARQHEPAGYIASLHLAAAIIASNDGVITREPVRTVYSSEIAELRELAVRGLGLASSDMDFIYGLEALMAFEDGGVWQRALSCLADGELPIECPDCQESILIDLEVDAPTADVCDAAKERTAVVPCNAQPGSVEDRLLTLASSHGHAEVAAKMPFLFGQITCPECRTVFGSADAL